LTTKLHLLAEGRGRSPVTRITPGQAADTKELVALIDALAVPAPGRQGRHAKRLAHLTADKAYGSKPTGDHYAPAASRTPSSNAMMCASAGLVSDPTSSKTAATQQ
jgi:hypothetical protein